MRQDLGIVHTCRRFLDPVRHWRVLPGLWTDSRSTPFIVVIVCLVFAMSSQPAWAYLDPGTGSMILQGLIGGIIGALVVGRLYWQKLKHFFSSMKKRENDNRSETAAKK